MIFINIFAALGTIMTVMIITFSIVIMLSISAIVAGIVMLIITVIMNLFSWIREKIKDRRMKKWHYTI